MPRILQINVSANWGSTGKIAEECNKAARQAGFDTYFAYRRMMNPSESKLIKLGSRHGKHLHYAEHILFDNEGLASRLATKKLIAEIKTIQPDIIHLHNLHDHWLNYRILFNYLNQTDINIVWTFHDFWAITGHCTHFAQVNCDKFKIECDKCPYTKGHILPLFKQEKRNFNLKKQLFTANERLILIAVSQWVGDNVRQSFLKNKEIRIIPNGIDTHVFKPTCFNSSFISKHPDLANRSKDKFVIMAVSSQWKSGNKGLDDYLRMSKLLKDDEIIVLVGVPEEMSKNFPSNIIGIRRTDNQQELAALYTRADVLCSFSSVETFGLTIVEGFACGTPAVVYDNTAPPSLISHDTGYIVPDKEYIAAYDVIQKIKEQGKTHYSEACIKRACSIYDKKKCFDEYMKIYRELTNNNRIFQKQ